MDSSEGTIEPPFEEIITPSVEIPVQEAPFDTNVESTFEVPVEDTVEESESAFEEEVEDPDAAFVEPSENISEVQGFETTEMPIEEMIESPMDNVDAEIPEDSVEPSTSNQLKETVDAMVETPIEQEIIAVQTEVSEVANEEIVGEPIPSTEVQAELNSEIDVEEKIENPIEEAVNMTISDNPFETPLESPSDEELEIEPVFDGLNVEETLEKPTNEISNETNVNAEEIAEVPSTEEVTEVEVISEAQIEEVTVEEVEPEVYEKTAIEGNTNETINHEVIPEEEVVLEEEEVVDDEELTIEENY